MKLELFALCQGAFNNNGQLTIVSTLDSFKVRSFPARISFGLALKFYIRPDEYGERLMSISILNDKGISIIPPIPAKFQIERLAKASHIALAINLQNVLFEAPGEYCVHLELDGSRFDHFAFEVIE